MKKSEKLNNVVVEVLNIRHGAEVIKAFKEKGVDSKSHTGFCCKNKGYANVFYGVIDGLFNNYTFNEVSIESARIITLEELKGEQPKEFPRMMLVWDDDEKLAKKHLVLEISNYNIKYPVRVLNEAYERELESGKRIDFDVFKHSKEIPFIEKMTVAQICKELGREIEVIE